MQKEVLHYDECKVWFKNLVNSNHTVHTEITHQKIWYVTYFHLYGNWKCQIECDFQIWSTFSCSVNVIQTDERSLLSLIIPRAHFTDD